VTRFRPVEAADAFACFRVFRSAIAELLARQPGGWASEDDDTLAWEEWRGLYEHLSATSDRAWLAEEGPTVVGYARSLRRGGLRQLTELYVAPDHRGQGIGRELLARTVAPEPGVARTIVATADPAALARYLRQGFRAHGAACTFEGRPRPDHFGADLDVRQFTAVDLGLVIGHLRAIDEAVLRTSRDEDHEWLASSRLGYLFVRDGLAAGYAYIGEHAGPVATLDPDDIPVALATLERHAVAAETEALAFDVPLTNIRAANYLLRAGYRIDPFTMHLMSDGGAFPARLDRYILTSPPFFL
jgi:GNAT superfamily N-acetyltransferase